jgi:hypothetical protein
MSQACRSRGERGEAVERGEVAVHAEDAIGDDESLPAVGRALQPCLQLRGIDMGITAQAPAGKPGGVDQRGVTEPVGEDAVAALCERAKHAKVRHVAGREQQCARPSGVGRELLFEFMMGATVSADQMRGAAAGAVTFRAARQRRDHRGVIGEAEIVVAAEGDVLPPVNRYLCGLRTVEDGAGAIQPVKPSLLQAAAEIDHAVMASGADWRRCWVSSRGASCRSRSIWRSSSTWRPLVVR